MALIVIMHMVVDYYEASKLAHIVMQIVHLMDVNEWIRSTVSYIGQEIDRSIEEIV